MLLERPPVREKELNKLRALHKMHSVMVKNKMGKAEIAEMFTKEEMHQIEDI